MKKLLLFLLIPFFSLAQFNPEKVCWLTVDEARTYADELVANSPQQFRFLKIVTGVKTDSFVYVPTEITDQQIKDAKKSYKSFDYIEVNYAISMKDKNDDLKIPGTKAYTLQSAYGQFLNIFPFWQKYYVPDATFENYKDYRKKEYRKDRLWIKFMDADNGYWYITAFVCG